ncbi:hypothetical protein BH11ACT8_BH11ACT8_27730 [soil metagenome]
MRVAVVALLAVLVSVFTIGPSGEQGVDGAEGEAGTVIRSKLGDVGDEQNVRLSLPTNVVQPRGLVIWFHGQGGNVNDRINTPFLTSLLRNGYAIASSDFHLQSWGNAASTDDATRLIAWAEEQTGAPVTLWVSGSMGGAISLNALTHGVEVPPCWYGVKPALSLTMMDAVPTGNRFIKLAYGGEVPVDRNPVRNFDALPSDVRYRVVASPDDQWVPIGENGGALLSKLDQRGVEVSYLPATGPHEDPSHWDAEDLVTFADSCAPDSLG